jgi:DNA topoisomerase-2
VGQILEGFYEPRLAFYEKRRLSEMERLEADAVVADAKARFIRAVLEGSLDLRRKSDEEIVTAMRKHELPVSADAKGKAEGIDGWDYLLRLRMDRVKATAVADAEEAVLVARKAVAELRETTAGKLWLKDLVDFEAALEIQAKARVDAASCTTKAPRKPVKKTVAK